MKIKPGELLEQLRGIEIADAKLCACGKFLIPVYDKDGKRIGFTHAPEDEDWHCEFFAGLRVVRD